MITSRKILGDSTRVCTVERAGSGINDQVIININIIVGIKGLPLTQVNARARRAAVTGHHNSLVCLSLFPVLLLPSSRYPINASPRRHQWHNRSPGSYSTGRCSPTVNEARHDHSYVRRNPRGPRSLSCSSPSSIRVWRYPRLYPTPYFLFLVAV